MSSREKILAAVARNQPEAVALPDLNALKDAAQLAEPADLLEKYITVLTGIGGTAYQVGSYEDITGILNVQFPEGRIVNTVTELHPHHQSHVFEDDIHSLENVELAIIKAHFAVAENGAVWVTEELMGKRVLPFICQHLVVIVPANQVVATMHKAYEQISNRSYGYGAFIAGPSKTADIEQSLVLGAHGPRSMNVFLLG
ncbi:LUD domain-containing protein [Mucilaginibacter sp. Bleaf8]|uniref:LutC/YkgG family protein n=1 Tax=Mucilaginibacter sp. Bleaf8 TaxID=2834430 RepID=UPI001BCFD4D0|nr:LUD domain-containing protein [Mucilaginibacter sp. Bleaf8]MBS7563928.1 LUD domain-containing protein [Mucilaginibacter sp. Bleaf8]